MTALKKLSRRERIFLGGGTALILAVVFYLYGIEPLQKRTVFLDQRIPQTEKALRTVAGLLEEYQFLSIQAQEIESRLPSKNQFSPLSYIEKVAVQNKVRGQMASIRAIPGLPPPGAYREIPMEVKMEGLSIDGVVSFLAAFDESPYFSRMKRLSLKSRYDDPGMLDVTFVIAFYEKI